MSYCFVNNAIVPTSGAYLSVQDLALHRGYTVFEYMRTYSGLPFHLDDHIARFFNSAKALHLKIPHTKEKIKLIIDELLHLSSYPEIAIKLFLTGGASPDGFSPAAPNFIIYCEPFSAPSLPPAISLETLPYQRPIPHAKTADYIPAIVALQETTADDLLYTSSTHLFECTRANFFAIKDNTLITPSEGVLEGITRKIVLSLSHIPIKTRPIALTEIPTFDEAFITSTTKEILPISQIDDTHLPESRPHTATLQTAYAAYAIQSPLTKQPQTCMN